MIGLSNNRYPEALIPAEHVGQMDAEIVYGVLLKLL
jgi:hypothetical protein